jgi:hypothetical protein
MACGAAALLGMGLLPGTALAGGNWIDLNRFHTSAGQRMSGEAVFYTRSKATEIRSRGPYFLYAAPESAGYRLPDPAAPATVRLARIQVIFPGRDSRFEGFDKHNPRGLLDFTMPEVAPGDYYISACNRACTSQLADLSTTCCLEVAANPTEARLNARIDRLATRLTTSTGSVRDDFRGPKKRLWRELAAVEGAASGRLDDLRANLADLRRLTRERSFPWALAVGAGAAGLAGGALPTAVVLRRRRALAFEAELSSLNARGAKPRVPTP